MALEGAGVAVGGGVGVKLGVASVGVEVVAGLAFALAGGVGGGAVVPDGLAVGLEGMQAASRIGRRASARWRRPGRWCRFTSR
jgi:hypothetical protein